MQPQHPISVGRPFPLNSVCPSLHRVSPAYIVCAQGWGSTLPQQPRPLPQVRQEEMGGGVQKASASRAPGTYHLEALPFPNTTSTTGIS